MGWPHSNDHADRAVAKIGSDITAATSMMEGAVPRPSRAVSTPPTSTPIVAALTARFLASLGAVLSARRFLGSVKTQFWYAATHVCPMDRFSLS